MPSRPTGFEDLWSTPGVLRIEGDSACGSNALRSAGSFGGAPADGSLPFAFSITAAAAARAEKNPAPCGGSPTSEVSSSFGAGGCAGDLGVGCWGASAAFLDG